MNIEFEVKVLDINTERLKAKLSDLGAEYKGSFNFKRYIFILNDENSWIRLRTDGSNHTLTYKKAVNDAIDGVEEVEVNVSNFSKTKSILQKCGLSIKSYQENSRELYTLDDVEVTIESWPNIPPYAEIEGKSKFAVEQMIDKLQFANDKLTSKPVSEIYKHYGLSLQ